MNTVATCPRCHQEMAPYATICPHCGYDFPLDDPNIERILPARSPRKGISHGWFGDVVILLASLFALLGIFGSLVAAVLFGVAGHWGQSLRALSMAFSCTVAYVVLQRVTDK